MLIYGVLSERGKWKNGVFDCEYSDTTVCKTEEEAKSKAYEMWNSLCDSDKKRAKIIVTKRAVTDEVIEDIKNRYYGMEDMEEIEEIAVSENCDVAKVYSIEEKEA